MAMSIGAKRVSDPLDERVKACSWYASSSGSEHDGDNDTSSSCLSDLIHGFLEPDESITDTNHHNEEEDDDNDNYNVITRTQLLLDTLQDLLNPYNKSDYVFRLRLHAQLNKASEDFAWLKPDSESGHRRAVMARLRQLGYNAGICKAKWEGSGGLTAGSYEYLDITFAEISKRNNRYIVDLTFVAQFEIARPSDEYRRLLRLIPRVVVIEPEELRQVVRVMSEAARRSLKSEGLSVPPWRKSRYMVAKWLGPYRRTVNLLPSATTAAGGEAKCRMVGFKAATFYH